MNRSRFFVILVMALVVLVSPTLFSQEEGIPAPEIAIVIGVHDGDTITVQFPNDRTESIRFIGIDTPEVQDPPSFCKHTQPFGRQAKNCTLDLLMYVGEDGELHGRTVRLVRDVSDRQKDSYRLLRHVYVIQEDGQELLVSEVLLAKGLAKVMTVAPDVHSKDHFLGIQKTARDAELGRWYRRG